MKEDGLPFKIMNLVVPTFMAFRFIRNLYATNPPNPARRSMQHAVSCLGKFFLDKLRRIIYIMRQLFYY